MATYIKTLKEDNEDIIYPQTKAEAVLLNNGSDLETELSQYVTAEDIASTSALTPPVQTNMIANGAVTTGKIANSAVTSDKIDWTTLIRTVSLSADATVNANTPVLSLTVPAGTWLIIATGRWYQGGLGNGIYRIVLDEQSFITNESTPDGTIRLLRGVSLVRTYTSSHTINLMTDTTATWTANATNLTALKIG